jgi:hypothetical protein
LAALRARIVPYAVEPEAASFPFGGKVTAAAEAEAQAAGKASVLVWLDADTLALQEPAGLLLSKDKSLACCPVHHRLIGAAWDEPLDIFWGLVYQYCHARDSMSFPVYTLVDDEKIRAYFNAGLLAVRPKKGLLRAWRDNFQRHYRREVFQVLYRQDERYAVFIHQAMLAATVLNLLRQEEIHVLDPRWNYPLHLHDKVVAANRARSLNDLITCRYEDPELLARGDWRTTVEIHPPLREWLALQLER